MKAWAITLANGPSSLSHKQRLALAADHARAFLARYEDEPHEAPAPSVPPEMSQEGEEAWDNVTAKLTPREREALALDLRDYLKASEERKHLLRPRLLAKHPILAHSLRVDASNWTEMMHGADTDKALGEKRLVVDAESRRLLNLEMAIAMDAAERGLEAMRDGDYSPVKELAVAPTFDATISSPPKAATERVLTLGQLLDHKAKTQNIKNKTVQDTRSHLQKFIAFIEHDDARRVTKEDVRRWRDSLIEEGKLSPKTITDRYISAIRAVLSHGVKEFDLPVNVASGIRDNRASAVPSGSKGYSEEQAIAILRATSGGSVKALSEPHRRAIAWVPWIAAYTGLRVSEITQLLGKRFVEKDGVPYLLITPEDGSTKSGKAWMVGVHQHLLEMGLKELMQSFGDKPVFYEPYPAGTILSEVKGKHRALEAGMRVARWITDEVGIAAPLGRPNHAWRHLHTTRSRLCGMDKEARDFMMGSRSTTDAREGYGDWPPEVLDREINKLPKFKTET
ncbi:tyrosine-type recombinase/integrase [Brucella intermedia]|uniref:tyrosine-type recombinase/integrase n=1 Tax=Brucella intermedia TaxID=94625 RepID=UPI00224B3380|nr:integrase [Brucella intermedia]